MLALPSASVAEMIAIFGNASFLMTCPFCWDEVGNRFHAERVFPIADEIYSRRRKLACVFLPGFSCDCDELPGGRGLLDAVV
jgi:hypothetical protein